MILFSVSLPQPCRFFEQLRTARVITKDDSSTTKPAWSGNGRQRQAASRERKLWLVALRGVRLRDCNPAAANVAPPHAEPTPAEEAAARAREAEEQAALPYKWTQTIGDLDVSISIPGNLKARDLVVDIKKTSLLARIKGQEPFIDVRFCVPAACRRVLRGN